MKGWIKLHRVLLEKALWKNSNLAQRSILITLLLMANHKDNQWWWKGEKYTCKSGEFITSLQSIVDANDGLITTRQVRTALAKFEKLGFLTKVSTKVSTKITIVNWGIYQLDKHEGVTEEVAEVSKRCQRGVKEVSTNKNVRMKEGKNINHISEEDGMDFDNFNYKIGKYKNVILKEKQIDELLDYEELINDLSVKINNGLVVENHYKWIKEQINEIQQIS